MEKLKIGTIVNTFGIRGELKVKIFTDFPEERFKKGNTILLEQEGSVKEQVVESYREHKGMALVMLKGINSINEVEKYKNSDLYIPKDQLHQLEEGEFYFFELVGFEVVDDKGTKVGFVKIVEEGTTSNYLRVEKEDKTTSLVPFMEPFVLRVNKEAKRIMIKPIEGLL